MEFTKLHGLGNDYLYIDTARQDLSGFSIPKLSAVLSDRHFGAGADGIILVEPSTVGDFKMRILNADGSEAEMCGNGVRGFGKYVFDHGLTSQRELQIETAAGLIGLALQVEDGRVATVRADMGQPRLRRAEIPMRGEPADQPVIAEPLTMGKYLFPITAVSMGNPHCVIFLPEVANFPVAEVGPLIENHELFPNRTNVEFARVMDRTNIEMRVWERGSGETMACGTGASATAVAGSLTGRTGRQVRVHLLGGALDIEWAADDHLFLTGPATEVYTATVRPEIIEPARL
ncbi:MAG TPA: diaminopimelate epimerase [Armatimonadota bacterium]|jgi:diaminopimelate epimerase